MARDGQREGPVTPDDTGDTPRKKSTMEGCLRYFLAFGFCWFWVSVRSYDCSDSTVYCTSEYGTPQNAVDACDTSDDCVILVNGPGPWGYLYIDDKKMSPGKKGLLIPSGSDVTIRSNIISALTITGPTEGWEFRGDDGYRLLLYTGAMMGISVSVNSWTGTYVKFGPGTWIYATDSDSTGVSLSHKNPDSQVVLEGVTIGDTTTPLWSAVYISGNMNETSPAWPSDARYIFRSCLFQNVKNEIVNIYRSNGVLLDGNILDGYGVTTGSPTAFSISQSSDIRIQNNLVYSSVPGYEWSSLVSLSGMHTTYRTQRIDVWSNTFDCLDTLPLPVAIDIFGTGDADEDPKQVVMRSNLFLGKCADATKFLISASGVEATVCQPTLEFSCYAAEPEEFLLGTADIGITNFTCAGNGPNASFGFAGAKPFPYYVPRSDFPGYMFGAANPHDIHGVIREYGSGPNTTIGCSESMNDIPTCASVPAYEWTTVCGGVAKCRFPDGCDCPSPYQFQNGTCVVLCEDGLPMGSENGCGGHGSCLAGNDTCVCTWPWVDTGDICDDFLCEDGKLGISQNSEVCNQHGHCSNVTSLCQCTGAWIDGVDGICMNWKCVDGKMNTDPTRCSNLNGDCSVLNASCICMNGYFYGEECGLCPTGYLNDTTCSVCDNGYTGPPCVVDNNSGGGDDTFPLVEVVAGSVGGAIGIVVCVGLLVGLVVCVVVVQQKNRAGGGRAVVQAEELETIQVEHSETPEVKENVVAETALDEKGLQEAQEEDLDAEKEKKEEVEEGENETNGEDKGSEDSSSSSSTSSSSTDDD